MNKITVLFLALILLPMVYAECVDLNNESTFGDKIVKWSNTRFEIRYNTTLCPGNYTLTGGLVVSNLYVTLDCNGATLDGGGIANQGVGIYVGRGASMGYSYYPYITVKNCNIKNYHSGIVLNLAYSNTIENNTITDVSSGMKIQAVKYNTIRNNIIRSGSYNGMTFERSINGWRTEFNDISGNTIESFSKKGIELNQVDNNTFKGNTIKNNVEYGVYSFNSNNNLFYNNRFENTNNVYSTNSLNVWNTQKTPGNSILGGSYLGGNYWNIYTGTDADNDGIGDSAYTTTSMNGNSDALPLVTQKCPNQVVCPDGRCADSIDNCTQPQIEAENEDCKYLIEVLNKYNVTIGSKVPKGIFYTDEMFNIFTMDNKTIGHLTLKMKEISSFDCNLESKPTFNVYIIDVQIIDKILSSEKMIDAFNDKLSNKDIVMKGTTIIKSIKAIITRLSLKVYSWFK